MNAVSKVNAHDLSARIDAGRSTVGTAERSQVLHHAVAVQKRMGQLIARKIAFSGDLTRIVDSQPLAVLATESAQILHYSAAIEISMASGIVCYVGGAGDLAAGVDTRCE